MPLLTCPNCNVAMTQVNRQGVELDICPSCRGVWLDRGELEKLLEPLRSEAPRDDFYRRDHGYSHDDHDDHHDRHGHDDHHGHGDYRGRRGRRSILDIFD